jgi:PAS domain S-box-containing protein
MDPELIIKWCGAASALGGVVWAVLRPGIKTVNLIDKKIDGLDNRVKRVEEQVHTNSGGSMMDSVKRIECNLGELHEDHRTLSMKFDLAEVRQGFLMRAQGLAYFETDRTGANSYVSPQFYHDILGATEEELMGQGWRNFMDPHDIEEFECEWVRAFQHRIRVEFDLPMLHAGGQKIWVRVILEPVGPEDPDMFLGLVTEIQGPGAKI